LNAFYHVEKTKSLIRKISQRWKRRCRRFGCRKRPHPIAEKDLVLALKEVGVDFTSLRDGWGTPYRIAFVRSGICVVSNGADKTPNTKDDYMAERFQMAVSSPASTP
jgi:hypothetical protein